MKTINFNYGKTLKECGINYLGATRSNTKLSYSYNKGWETYGVNLAPATMARDEKHPHLNVCPFSQMCAKSCLNGSGQNKCATLHEKGLSHIDRCRIKKTHLYYDNRDTFMDLLIHEIKRYKNHASKNGMGFAIRLNCTSDLSPLFFTKNGKNILEIFKDIQFYDYTKVPSRLTVAKLYPNYDITFSYDGQNWGVCEAYLKDNGKVAVVFDLYDENGKQYLPKEWRGYKVIDANNYDMRFLDPKGCIMGLHYHRVANDYLSGKYKPIETPFVIRSL